MNKYKQRYLYDKAWFTEKYSDYKNALENIEDIDRLIILIGNFLKRNNCSLSDLLGFNINNIDMILTEFFSNRCSAANTYLFDNRDIDLLLEKNYTNVILAIEEYYVRTRRIKDLYILIDYTKIYNDYILGHLHNGTAMLFELYKKTNDEKIIDVVCKDGATKGDIYNFRNVLTKEQQEKLIKSYVSDNSYLDELELSDKLLNIDDLKCICKLKLKDNTVDQTLAYFFLRDRCYNDEEERKILIDIIIKSSVARDIYRTLTYVKLNDEERKELEKHLKDSNNFQYNFYYNFWNNRQNLLEVFGGYEVLRNFLEKYWSLFGDKHELKRVCSVVNKFIIDQKVIVKNLQTLMFKDDAKEDKAVAKKVKKQQTN